MRKPLSKGPALASAVAAIICVFLAFDASATDSRTDELRIETEIIVPPLGRLETTPGSLLFPVATAADMAAGYVDMIEPVTLTVHSNSAWELYARSVGDDTEATPGPRGGPGRLLWRIERRAFSDLTNRWTRIASGESCAAGSTVQFRLRVPLSWTTTAPGRYELRIEYKLSSSPG